MNEELLTYSFKHIPYEYLGILNSISKRYNCGMCVKQNERNKFVGTIVYNNKVYGSDEEWDNINYSFSDVICFVRELLKQHEKTYNKSIDNFLNNLSIKFTIYGQTIEYSV